MSEKYRHSNKNRSSSTSSGLTIESVLRIIGIAIIAIQAALLFVMFYLIPQVF